MEKCLLYLSSTTPRFLFFPFFFHWMVFDVFSYCVAVKTIYIRQNWKINESPSWLAVTSFVFFFLKIFNKRLVSLSVTTRSWTRGERDRCFSSRNFVSLNFAYPYLVSLVCIKTPQKRLKEKAVKTLSKPFRKIPETFLLCRFQIKTHKD